MVEEGARIACEVDVVRNTPDGPVTMKALTLFAFEGALIAAGAVVGEGMVHVPGILAGITSSLARRGINVSIANQGENEMVILIGVAEADADNAVRAIYNDQIRRR